MKLLTEQNYSKGFLIDEELMGGVSRDPQKSDRFVAYVIRHATAETIASLSYDSLDEALEAINRVRRDWSFEASGGCGDCQGAGGEACRKAAGGGCAYGGCGPAGT